MLVETSTTSDHAVLTVCLVGVPNGIKRKSRFHFEARWFLKQGYNEMISHEWNKPPVLGDKWTQVAQKIIKCKCGILKWQKGVYGSSKKKQSPT